MADDIKTRLARATEDEAAILDAFGFEQEWRQFPLSDSTNLPWFKHKDTVVWFDSQESVADGDTGKSYSAHSIRKHYKTEDLSAFVLDHQSDGNISFEIFDDALMITDKQLIKDWAEEWGSGWDE